MTKAELKKAVAQKINFSGQGFISKEDATNQIVEATIETIFEELNTPNGTLTVRGLGTFKNILSGKKKARNISKGTIMELPPRRKVTFKPSKKFNK